MMLPCSARPDVGKTIRSHLGRLQDDREAKHERPEDRNDRPCAMPRSEPQEGGRVRAVSIAPAWDALDSPSDLMAGTGWSYPSARPCCPGTSSDGCCSGRSDGTLGGNGRPSATAHHCCMYQRFPFRHRRLSIRTRGRGGGRDRDHPP